MVQCSQAELILRQPVRQGLLVEIDCNKMQEEFFSQDYDACSKECLWIASMAVRSCLEESHYLHDFVDRSPIRIGWLIDGSNDRERDPCPCNVQSKL